MSQAYLTIYDEICRCFYLMKLYFIINQKYLEYIYAGSKIILLYITMLGLLMCGVK